MERKKIINTEIKGKTAYRSPEIEIIELDHEDIITASDEGEGNSSVNTGPLGSDQFQI